MVLGKVTKDFGGSNGEVYKIGEVLRKDLNDPLFRVGFLLHVEEDYPLVKCSCGRQFMRIEGDRAEQEQLLTAHCDELGEGHRPAKVAEREKVAA